MNSNFNVALSTDDEGVCIIWDLNKQQFLRTLMKCSSDRSRPINAVFTAISNTMGDFAVVSYTYSDPQKSKIFESKLSIFTLNGFFIGDVKTAMGESYFTALCYSNCPEGLSINVIATGMSDGSIRLWNSWDLTLVRHIKLDLVRSKIKW